MVNSTIKTIFKTDPKLLAHLNGTDRQ